MKRYPRWGARVSGWSGNVVRFYGQHTSKDIQEGEEGERVRDGDFYIFWRSLDE